jgi:hypothetical protein
MLKWARKKPDTKFVSGPCDTIRFVPFDLLTCEQEMRSPGPSPFCPENAGPNVPGACLPSHAGTRIPAVRQGLACLPPTSFMQFANTVRYAKKPGR